VTPPTAPASKPEARDFVYIKSRKRKVSEYEAVNLHVQPAIEGGWDIGPSYLRTPEGRQSWEITSTKLRHPEWHDFRDPSSLWQRPYMRMQAEQERAIARLTEDVALGDVAAEIDPTWLNQIIGEHYAVWSFVEWGLFRALFPATREALSDTIVASMLFETFDRARHSQDIVHYLLMLEEKVPGFDATGAKQVWLDSPRYQPMRKLIEEVMHTVRDWAETFVIINLVLDPILTEVAISSLVGKLAPLHGDVVSRVIVASVNRDRRRDLAWTEEFVRMVTAEGVPAAAENKALIAGWVEKWRPAVIEATEQMAGLYELLPSAKTPFPEVLAAALNRQAEIVRNLGLTEAQA
jgi:methane monooxygenase component A beta chain/propane monooxygenase small subunit